NVSAFTAADYLFPYLCRVETSIFFDESLNKSNKYENKILMLSMLCLVAITAWGQGVVTEGLVKTASNNEPVIGASVLVKGTTTGVITDHDGRFSVSS